MCFFTCMCLLLVKCVLKNLQTGMCNVTTTVSAYYLFPFFLKFAFFSNSECVSMAGHLWNMGCVPQPKDMDMRGEEKEGGKKEKRSSSIVSILFISLLRCCISIYLYIINSKD